MTNPTINDRLAAMLNMIAESYAIRRACIQHDPGYTNHARHLLDQSLRLQVMAERWLEPPVPRLPTQ